MSKHTYMNNLEIFLPNSEKNNPIWQRCCSILFKI